MGQHPSCTAGDFIRVLHFTAPTEKELMVGVVSGFDGYSVVLEGEENVSVAQVNWQKVPISVFSFSFDKMGKYGLDNVDKLLVLIYSTVIGSTGQISQGLFPTITS